MPDASLEAVRCAARVAADLARRAALEVPGRQDELDSLEIEVVEARARWNDALAALSREPFPPSASVEELEWARRFELAAAETVLAAIKVWPEVAAGLAALRVARDAGYDHL